MRQQRYMRKNKRHKENRDTIYNQEAESQKKIETPETTETRGT